MGFRAPTFTINGPSAAQRCRHQRRYPCLPHLGKRIPSLFRGVQSRASAANAARAYSGAPSPPQRTERPGSAGTLTQPPSSPSHSPFRGNPNESNSRVHSPLRMNLKKNNLSPCPFDKPRGRCGCNCLQMSPGVYLSSKIQKIFLLNMAIVTSSKFQKLCIKALKTSFISFNSMTGT